jgi:3-deoxy-manno-octulosonate cytidylyltransferase (CMP-KDO synthetase)
MRKFTAIIPARFNSERLPGKPLILISGKTMIERVYEQVKKCEKISETIVATDDWRIFEHVKTFGGKAVMTDIGHNSGTDRCYEAAVNFGIPSDDDNIIINIQGDEPFIKPEQIDLLCSCFHNPQNKIATLVKPIDDPEELFNTSKPKVILNKQNKAIYFSRAPIPFLRKYSQPYWLSHHTYYKHIGIYGFTVKTLKEITSIPQSKLEKAEALEQLRWIENGHGIHAEITEYDSFSVDTPEDLEKINTLYSDFL